MASMLSENQGRLHWERVIHVSNHAVLCWAEQDRLAHSLDSGVVSLGQGNDALSLDGRGRSWFPFAFRAIDPRVISAARVALFLKVVATPGPNHDRDDICPWI